LPRERHRKKLIKKDPQQHSKQHRKATTTTSSQAISRKEKLEIETQLGSPVKEEFETKQNYRRPGKKNVCYKKGRKSRK
jgi:hypothetical protein